jgi:hypothetical protein
LFVAQDYEKYLNPFKPNQHYMNEEKEIKKVKGVKKVKEVESPVKSGLKTKEEIVKNWLPRYTGRPLEEFGKYILLTNFSKYLQRQCTNYGYR